MDKLESLDTILHKIYQKKIDDANDDNTLTTSKKQDIYYGIIEAMIAGHTSFPLYKYGLQNNNSENGVQKQIRNWLNAEHKIKCRQIFIDANTTVKQPQFYFEAYWIVNSAQQI